MIKFDSPDRLVFEVLQADGSWFPCPLECIEAGDTVRHRKVGPKGDLAVNPENPTQFKFVITDVTYTGEWVS